MKIFLFLAFLPQILFAKNFVPSSFSTNFEESSLSSTTGKEKKSFGKIDYKYPGQIYFQVTSPNPTTFVSNTEKSWYYTPAFVAGEQGEVTIQKSSKLPLTKFLDSIREGLENSKMFTTKFEGKKLTLVFLPGVQKEMTLKEVVLESSKEAKTAEKLSDFEKLTLHYLNGQIVNLKFVELKEEVIFPGQHFTFIVPPKTKVTGN
jgi:outer membrane lipoprotein-sorting protein